MAFELGATLRQAREKRQLAFEEIAAATRIHPRYLAALEAERFDTLPGRAYARSFLHEYAQHLGLDPSPFVVEYDHRFAPASVAPQPLVPVQRRRREHSFRGGFVVGAALIVGAVGVLAWKFGGEPTSPKHVVASDVTPGRQAAPQPPPTKHALATASAPAPKFVVVNAFGDCWLSVHTGSATGPVVWEGTLQPGQTKRFAQRPLWIRFGAPWNVNVRLDGKAVTLPSATQPVNLLFTSSAQPA